MNADIVNDNRLVCENVVVFSGHVADRSANVGRRAERCGAVVSLPLTMMLWSLSIGSLALFLITLLAPIVRDSV
jgi:hypothetical protein